MRPSPFLLFLTSTALTGKILLVFLVSSTVSGSSDKRSLTYHSAVRQYYFARLAHAVPVLLIILLLHSSVFKIIGVFPWWFNNNKLIRYANWLLRSPRDFVSQNLDDPWTCSYLIQQAGIEVWMWTCTSFAWPQCPSKEPLTNLEIGEGEWTLCASISEVGVTNLWPDFDLL